MGASATSLLILEVAVFKSRDIALLQESDHLDQCGYERYSHFQGSGHSAPLCGYDRYSHFSGLERYHLQNFSSQQTNICCSCPRSPFREQGCCLGPLLQSACISWSRFFLFAGSLPQWTTATSMGMMAIASSSISPLPSPLWWLRCQKDCLWPSLSRES